MTKVRMLKTVKGSPNGLTVQNYKIGEVYDIPDALLKCFIDDGAVELAKPKKIELENKIIEDIETPEIVTKKRGRKS